MKLKGIDIFCASQASTAICFSMDQASSSSSVIQLGGRAIDRHNPIIQDSRRSSTSTRFINPPCYSHPPINPKTYHQLQKCKKNSSSSKTSSDQCKKKIVSFSKEKYEQKRKSTSSNGKMPSDDNVKKYSSVPSGSVVRKSSAEPVDLISSITPPGSSRYLLSDKVFFEGLPDYEPVSALVPVGDKENRNKGMNKQQEYESASSASSSSSLSKLPSPPSNQVVVLRVSLHCKGCEGKLRKHLSRMEGVTSFNIDFAAKKVTVMGDVTPVSVLASVSKVKNAQFWPTVSTTPSASPAPCPTQLKANN
ncbi:protein SODIUM POTASSIUM ROOT DEFECTIVE 1-like [Argentina anserina]|uniref:protein SODIUM POTASSIUM ROOT DEFECTIVE 1-like n=1 Tax=Argentina anserina TaxID=57926 RepID=UPI002176608A|nr:protein SODIUM POTASSIUM ROOT DEFECTIVE 1-like [Potentilla anserina]